MLTYNSLFFLLVYFTPLPIFAFLSPTPSSNAVPIHISMLSDKLFSLYQNYHLFPIAPTRFWKNLECQNRPPPSFS